MKKYLIVLLSFAFILSALMFSVSLRKPPKVSAASAAPEIYSGFTPLWGEWAQEGDPSDGMSLTELRVVNPIATAYTGIYGTNPLAMLCFDAGNVMYGDYTMSFDMKVGTNRAGLMLRAGFRPDAGNLLANPYADGILVFIGAGELGVYSAAGVNASETAAGVVAGDWVKVSIAVTDVAADGTGGKLSAAINKEGEQKASIENAALPTTAKNWGNSFTGDLIRDNNIQGFWADNCRPAFKNIVITNGPETYKAYPFETKLLLGDTNTRKLCRDFQADWGDWIVEGTDLADGTKQTVLRSTGIDTNIGNGLYANPYSAVEFNGGDLMTDNYIVEFDLMQPKMAGVGGYYTYAGLLLRGAYAGGSLGSPHSNGIFVYFSRVGELSIMFSDDMAGENNKTSAFYAAGTYPSSLSNNWIRIKVAVSDVAPGSGSGGKIQAWAKDAYGNIITTGETDIPELKNYAASAVGVPAVDGVQGFFCDGGVSSFKNIVVTKDALTYKAFPFKKYSTITFNTDGAASIAPVSGYEGFPVSTPSPEPVKIGCLFGGWYSDSGFTTPYTFVAFGNTNENLYVKWLADKAALQSKYNEYKDIAKGNYTDDSYQTFAAALIAADTVLKNANATAANVSDALAALNMAHGGLTEKTAVVADKSALQAKYNEYKDTAQGEYTDASYAAFQTALANAKAALDKADASQTEIDAALTALNGAYNGLKTAAGEKGCAAAANFGQIMLLLAGFGILVVFKAKASKAV